MGPVGDLGFVIVLLGGLVAWVLWGWKTWMRRRSEPRSASVVASVIGFSLASLSALLQIGTGIYALSFGGLPFMDPTLLRIYGIGLLLSTLGLISGLCGSFRNGPLRFKAPALSTFLLLLWLAQVAGE